MPEQRLRTQLDQLREELARTPNVDAEGEELLRGIQDDIEAALDRREEALARAGRGKIRQAIDRFGESHPELVGALQNVLDSLANVGF